MKTTIRQKNAAHFIKKFKNFKQRQLDINIKQTKRSDDVNPKIIL